jgi:hypothetical protein
MQYAFPMAFGVTSIGPYPVFQGGDMLGILFDPTGANGTATGYFGFNDGVIKYFIQQDPNSTSTSFNYLAWQPRIQQLSAMWDAKDPNLDPLRRKGGKLLLVQGTTDMLIPPSSTTAYYDSLVSRYGQDLKSFARYYMVPGFGHASGTFKMTWDSLQALDSWVDDGKAPVDPITTDAAQGTAGRTRPLCEYPQFPKYIGSGDANVAANFTCESN